MTVLLFGLEPSLTAGPVSIDGKAGWTAIMYGINQDPAGDSQAGAADTDIVGDDAHGSLYAIFDDNGTATSADDTLIFRLRMDNPSSPGVFVGVAVVGMDVNKDGRVDLFMQVDARNNGRVVRLMDPGADANLSPSTTSTNPLPVGWLPSNGVYPFSSSNFNSAVVTAANDPHWTTEDDLGADGKTDAFVSWRVPIADMAVVLGKPSPMSKNGVYGPRGEFGISPEFTKDTLVRYVAFSQTQSGPINGDLLGVGRTYDRNATFESLGTFTEEMSASDPVSAGPQIGITTPISGGLLNSTNNSSASISGTSNYLDGELATLTVTDGTTGVTGNTTIASGGGWTVSGLDLSVLADGLLTVTVTAQGVSDTATVLHDQTPPSVAIDPMANSAGEPTITGTSDLPDGSVLTVVIDPDNNLLTANITYQVVVSGGEWTLDTASTAPVAGVMPSTGLTSYAKITATGTDAAGNSTSVDALNPPTVKDSATNSTTPVLTGTWTNIDGDELHVTISGATYYLSPAGNFWSLNLDGATPDEGSLTPLAQGQTYPVTATVHRGADSAEGTGQVEITVTLVVTVEINGGATASGSDTTPVISGTSQNAGGYVLVRIDPDNDGDLGDAVYYSVIPDGSGNWSLNTGTATPVSGTPPPGGFEGATGILASDSTGDVTDTQVLTIVVPTVSITGIVSTATADGFAVVDNSPGAGDAWLNFTESTAVTINGTATGGATVDVVVTDRKGATVFQNNVAVSGGTWSATGLDLSGLGDGVLAVRATVTGTAASVEDTSVTLDTLAPKIFTTTPEPLRHNNAYSYTGVTNIPAEATAATAGASPTVTVLVTNVAGGATIGTSHTAPVSIATDGSWSVINSGLSNGLTVNVLVTPNPAGTETSVRDVAGNIVQPLAFSRTVSNSPPTTPGTLTINAISTDDVITVADISPGPLTITGTSSLTTGIITVVITDGEVSYSKPVAAAATWFITLTATEVQALKNGSLSVTATHPGAPPGTPALTAVRLPTLNLADPVLSITDNTAGTATGAVTFTFTFAEGVTGFDTTDVVVANGTKGTFTAVNTTTYTLVVTPPVESTGIIEVSVATGAAAGVSTGRPSTGATATQEYDTTTPPTPPTITIDTTDLAASSTPTITGTTSLQAGSSILVEIDLDNDGITDLTYTATVQSGGTWSLDTETAIPDSGAFPEGGLEPWARVTATATNAAAQSTSVTGLNRPTVDPLVTNDTTPTVTGTWTEVVGDTLEVTLDGVVYSEANTNLTVTLTGWSLTVDSGDALTVDGAYEVVATVTRGGDSLSDTTTNELVIDTLATIAIDGGAEHVTGDSTPVISGTSTGLPSGTLLTLSLDLDGDGIADLEYKVVTGAGGAWSVDTATAIPTSGTFPAAGLNGLVDIAASATDPAGNAALAEQELTVDTSASITFTTNPSTNDTTPVITGTTDIEPGRNITIYVDTDNNGTYENGPYTATVQADGTWSVEVTTTLNEGTVGIQASGTDAVGNSATTTATMIIDLSAPVVSITTPLDNPGNGDDILNRTENDAVVLRGTSSDIDPGSSLYVAITDGFSTIVDSAIVGADGAWELDPINLGVLDDGVLTMTVTFIDNFGATFSDVATVLHDNTAPTAVLSSDDTAITGPTTVTVTFNEPVFGLTADDFEASNGATVTNLVDIGNNQYTFTLTPAVDGSASVWLPAGMAADEAGNGNDLSNTLPFTVTGLTPDNVAPTVISISRQDPLAEVTNATGVIFRVSFSEAVKNVTTSSFEPVAADDGAIIAGIDAVAGVAGTGDAIDGYLQYDVTIDGLEDNNGILELAFAVAPGITDSAGNSLTDTSTDEAPETYLLDTIAPVISSGSVVYSSISLPVTETGSGLVSITPATGSFILAITRNDTSTYSILVNSVSINTLTDTITLSLAGSVAYDDVVEVAYTAPGSNPIQDAAGNPAPDFTITVSNDTPAPDLTAPVVDLAPSDGGTIDYTGVSPFGAEVGMTNASDPATVTEASDELANLFIAVAGLQDGAEEELRFGATVVAANGSSGSQADILVGGVRINVTYSGGAFTIQRYNYGPLTTAEAGAVIGDIHYQNTAALVTEGDRSFTFTAEDVYGNLSAGAVATVSVTVEPADAAASTLTPTASSIPVGGSTQVLTVTAKDSGGNALPAGGASVVITRLSGTGTVGSVTDNLDGTYSATVTSPTASGSGVFVATLDGDPVQSAGATQTEATVTYTAGPAAGITLVAPDDVIAGSISDQLTLTVVDVYGNPTVAGTATTFSLSSSHGGTASFYSADSNPITQVTVGAGETSALFRYGNTVAATTHLVTVTGVSGNAALVGDTANDGLEVLAAAPAQLTLTGPVSVTAGGVANFLLTVRDAYGNPTEVSADTTFALSSTSSGTVVYNPVSPVTVASGTSFVNFTYSDTEAGLQTVTAATTGSPADNGLAGDSATHAITVTAATASLAHTSVTSDPVSILADGTSTSTITIQLKDEHGNDTSLVGGPVTLATDAGELLATLVDEGGGSYTQDLESSTTVETATLTASLDGNAVTDTATVDFVAGVATVEDTTVTADPTSITANGTSTSAITIRLKDAFGNDTTLRGGPVTLATNAGALLATLVDNGDGTYTQQLESGTVVEMATLTASLDGEAVTDTATVDFTAGPATLANTTVTADPTSITADGVTTSTITIRLKDAFGNDTTQAGGTVTLAADAGTLLATLVDNGDGTYTQQLQSSTTASTATLTASIEGDAVTDTATVDFVAGTATLTNTTVTANPVSITADGTSTSTITIQLKDAYDNNTELVGGLVTLASDAGTLLSSLVDNGGGEYTQDLQSSTTVETATLTASLDGDAVTETATVAFIAGAATLANTVVTASPATIDADGTSTSTVTIQLKDAFDNNTELVDAPVTLEADAGTLLASLVNNGGGEYTQQLQSSTVAGIATLTAKLNGAAVEDTATVEFTAGTATVANTTVTADPTSITADGSSTSTITIQLRDSFGNPTALGGTPVTLETDAGTLLGSLVDNGGGEYTQTLQSSTNLETATLTAKLNGVAVTDTATVEFAASVPSAFRITTADTTTFTAGGGLTMTVALADQFGNTITTFNGDLTLTFSGLSASASGDDPTATDNTPNAIDFGQDTVLTFASGLATADLTAFNAESSTVHVLDKNTPAVASTATGGAGLDVVILGAAATVADTTVTADPTSITADGSSISTITIQFKDTYGNETETVTGAVTLETDAGTLLSSLVNNGGGEYTQDLKSETVAGTATLVAKLDGVSVVDTATVDFVTGAASAFRITTADPTTFPAGTGATLTVELVDDFGNVVDFDGDLTLNFSGLSASPSGDDPTTEDKNTVAIDFGQDTVLTFVNGAAVAELTAFNAESSTIHVLDTNTPAISSTATGGEGLDVVVEPGPADRLAIQTQPSSEAVVNEVFGQQPVIRLEDEYGNLVSSDSSTEVTVAVATGSGTIQGTTTGTAVSGIVTFTDLYHPVVGDITLEFTSDPVLTAATSNTISITDGPPAGLLLTGPASVAVNGVSGNFTLTVVDAEGTAVPVTENTTFTLTSTSGGTVTFDPAGVTIPSGQSSVTFTYTDSETGTKTITATPQAPADAGLTGEVGTASIDVNSAAPIASFSGSALLFNGVDQYAEGTLSDPDAFGDAVTIEVWLRRDDSDPAPLANETILAKGPDWSLRRSGGSGDLEFFTTGVIGTSTLSNALVASGTFFDAGWNHVAAVYDKAGQSKKVYLNGALIAQETVAGTLADTSGRFRMGANGAASAGDFYAGAINEVRVWNVVRDAGQLAAMRLSRLAGVEFGLMHYWRLDEGNGITVSDAVGGSDLTLVNGQPWFEPESPNRRALGIQGLDIDLRAVGFDFSGGEITAFVTVLPTSGTLYQMLPNGDRGDLIALGGLGEPAEVTDAQGRLVYAPPDESGEGFDSFQYIVESGGVPSVEAETVVIDLESASILGGTAVRLDPFAGQYVMTPNLRSYFLDNAVTIEVWFRAAGPGVIVSELGQTEIDKGWQNSQLEVVDIDGVQGQVRARVWNLPEADATTLVNGINLGTVTYGEWNHAAVRYNPIARLVDGALNGVVVAGVEGDRLAPWETIIVDAYNQASRPGIFYAFGARDRQHLGSGGPIGQLTNNYFNGDIDEVRIWNAAIPDDRLAAARSFFLKDDYPNLVALYRFDEPIGSTVREAGEAAKNATIVNGGSRVQSGADLNLAETVRQESFVVEIPGFHQAASEMSAWITRMPLSGAIYQYGTGGTLGDRIANVPTKVTDTHRRILFVPANGGTFDSLEYETRFNANVYGPQRLRFRVDRVNQLPEIDVTGVFAGGLEGMPLTISYADLATALNAVDDDGTTIGFRVESVLIGSLSKNGVVVPTVTTISAGESVVWTPPPYVNSSNHGGPLGAFTVVAFDGRDFSDQGTVQVSLDPVATNPVANFPGTALQLQGSNQFVFTKNLRPIFREEDLTIEVWFRADGPGVIISERAKANLSGWNKSQLEVVSLGETQGRVRAHIWGMSTMILGEVEWGSWNHAVIRYDSASQIFDGYLNGVRVNEPVTGNRTAPWESGLTGLFYGFGLADNNHLGDGGYFEGQLREVRMWNIARNAAAIQTSYPGILTGDERGLAAWYRFNEGIGTAIIDHGPFGQNAALVNGPEWVDNVPTVIVSDDVEIVLEGFDPDGGAIEFVISALPGSGQLFQSDGTTAITQGAVVTGPHVVYQAGETAGADSFNYQVRSVVAPGRISTEETVDVSVEGAAEGMPMMSLSAMTEEERSDVVRVTSAGLVKSHRDLIFAYLFFGEDFDLFVEPVEVFRLEFSVEKNRPFVVEFSDDLRAWRPVHDVYTVVSGKDPLRLDGVAEVEAKGPSGFMRVRVDEVR